jgi:hypothetical protein
MWEGEKDDIEVSLGWCVGCWVVLEGLGGG